MTRRVDSFKGTPEQPLGRAEMRDKFLLLTKACDHGAMARLFERLQNLEAERDLEWIKVEAAKKKSTGMPRRRAQQRKKKQKK